MERYSEIIGLPVISADNGKKAGVVKDVIFSPLSKRAIAYLVEKPGYNFRKSVVLFNDILSTGKDAIIINNCTCISALSKFEKSEDFKSKGEIIGLSIYSKKGENLGIVKDILFDNKTGSLEGVEVSDGLVKDIVKGRSVIPLFGKVEFGEENILVGMEAIEEIIENNKGLKKILED